MGEAMTAPPPWGFESETGRLREILLCRPDHYAWQPTNAVARATMDRGEALDTEALAAAFGELEDALAGAGVALRYLEPDPHLPYQVYTRDSLQMTPWGAYMPQLFRPQRRGEIAAVTRFLLDEAIPIWGWATAGAIEGGDIHFLKPGVCLIGASGERTTLAGANQLAERVRAEGWEARIQPFDEHFLHMDLLICMAAEGLAVICPDALPDDFPDWLAGRGVRALSVSYRDTMAMGCNLLALGDDRVLSSAHAVDLNARLRAEGLTVLDPDPRLFAAGGGSAHCMTMPLRRDRG